MREETELSPSFAEFVSRNEKTADVWTNCHRPDRLLEILKEAGYCNCENVEGFIDSLSMLNDDNNDEVREQALREYFNYQPHVDQLRQRVESGNLSQSEARRLRFIGVRITALEAIRYIFEDKVGSFQFNNLFAQIMSEETGAELSVTNVDEIEFKHTVLKEMADMLRQNIGNPFLLARPNDFDYLYGAPKQQVN